jgi:hypothetical protein
VASRWGVGVPPHAVSSRPDKTRRSERLFIIINSLSLCASLARSASNQDKKDENGGKSDGQRCNAR